MTCYTVTDGDGNQICDGVSDNEIAHIAQRHANRLGKTVYVTSSDNDNPDSEQAWEPEPEDEDEPSDNDRDAANTFARLTVNLEEDES